MGWAETHLPCPECGSSDALSINDDGWGTCFSCQERFPPDTERAEAPVSKDKAPLIRGEARGEAQDLVKRGLHTETLQKFGYTVGSDHGVPIQIAPYHDAAGKLVAQKIRYADKTFRVAGDLSAATLFGQKLWSGKNDRFSTRLVITEGEIDCLAYAQATSLKWPVVSVPNGASGAAKAIKAQLEFVESFDDVVLLLDNDEPGRKAAEEIARLLSPGKARVASLPLKDAGAMVEDNRDGDLCRAVYNAAPYRPDGIVTMADIREGVLKPIETGLPWFLPSLTAATYGRRYGEAYAFGAGTGIGKTDLYMQQMAHDVMELGEKVGAFLLEQTPDESGKRLAGKIGHQLFHVPGEGWDPAQLEGIVDDLIQRNQVFWYDSFGTTEWERIRTTIRYLYHAEGVRLFYLDHLTALATAGDDERKVLEKIMAEIGGLVKEVPIILHFISHLATPEGKPHEEGGRVMIRHFKGSRAIGFWSHFMFGLERNQQSDDPDERGRSILRVLKDRYTGRSTGLQIPLSYDEETGMISEGEDPRADDFAPTGGDADDNPF